MLYGLSTAPAAWCKVMQDIFGDLPNLLFYLDDVIIISPTFEAHIQDLSAFLDKCIENGLTLSQQKIHTCKSEMEFLGHKIDADGIRPLHRHIKAINDFPIPNTKKGLKRFLGMCQFNAKMVKDTSVTLRPLHLLCSQKVPFIWKDIHQKAFEKIEEK